MFWKKNSVTKYSVTMDGNGAISYEQRHGYYWSGPFLNKGVVLNIHFGKKEVEWCLSRPQEIVCYTAGKLPQPGNIVPHQAVCYYKGDISPDQSKTMKDDLMESLRQHLQNKFETAQATYLAMTSAWGEHFRNKQDQEAKAKKEK